MNQSLNDDLQRQLMALFMVEAQEHNQAINQNLLAIEAQPKGELDAKKLADIMREAHSLKGAARAVNLVEVETLAHHLESLFSDLQNGKIKLEPEVFDLTYKALDAIGMLVQKTTGTGTSEVDVAGLVSNLDRLSAIPQTEKKQLRGTDVPKEPSQKKGKKSTGEPDSGSPTSPFPIPDELVRAPGNSSGTATAPNLKKRPVSGKGKTARTSGAKTVTHSTKNKLGGIQSELSKETLPLVQDEATSGEPSGKAVQESHHPEETIRLTTTKLDALMSQMGELQVTRIGTEQRLVELHNLEESIAGWEAEWRKTRPQYRALLLASEPESIHGTLKASVGTLDGNNRMKIQPVLEFLQANETHLRRLRENVVNLNRVFKADGQRMAQVTADMEEEIRQTRMLPVSTVFNTFPRMVRDLAHDQNKEIILVVEGGETEVDRSVLEQIKDPLLHLLRNSVDHGIEIPEKRTKAGKARQGTILLKAAQQGDGLMIEIADDGAGVDLTRVRAAAVKKHILSEEAAAALSDREALWLIFHSGLSTSPIITDLSGRGVGLDVVHEQVEHLHGVLDVENQPGLGVRFMLTVPLTVATTECLLVQAGCRKTGNEIHALTFAIPIVNVLRLIRFAAKEISFVEGRQTILLDGEPLALERLSDVLGLESNLDAKNQGKLPAVVVRAAEKRLAFLVDVVLGAQEMVIKSLPHPLLRVRNAAGATILGNGAIVVILHAGDLIASAENLKLRMARNSDSTGQVDVKVPVIMVVDDSITTRTLEKNILEASGYQIRTASDGMDAWTQLQTETCDLLVSDVLMPRMDGIALTSKLRADEHFKLLPIILVTSLDSPQDRERGVQAGADAYIIKSAFDQEGLLDTIRRLI